MEYASNWAVGVCLFGATEVEGLQRKLVNKLSPVGGVAADWDISECAGVWWRPNFDNLFYPYLPPHITRPKVRACPSPTLPSSAKLIRAL